MASKCRIARTHSGKRKLKGTSSCTNGGAGGQSKRSPKLHISLRMFVFWMTMDVIVHSWFFITTHLPTSLLFTYPPNEHVLNKEKRIKLWLLLTAGNRDMKNKKRAKGFHIILSSPGELSDDFYQWSLGKRIPSTNHMALRELLGGKINNSKPKKKNLSLFSLSLLLYIVISVYP